MHGTFNKDVNSVTVNTGANIRFPDGRSGSMRGSYDLCDHATVRQESEVKCPPKMGEVEIECQMNLAGDMLGEVSWASILSLPFGEG